MAMLLRIVVVVLKHWSDVMVLLLAGSDVDDVIVVVLNADNARLLDVDTDPLFGVRVRVVVVVILLQQDQVELSEEGFLFHC